MGLSVQMLHGLPDPFLLGVSTDLLAQFSLETVRGEGTVRWSALRILPLGP